MQPRKSRSKFARISYLPTPPLAHKYRAVDHDLQAAHELARAVPHRRRGVAAAVAPDRLDLQKYLITK